MLVPVAFAQNQRDEGRLMEVAGALAAEPGMKQTTYLAFDCKVAGDTSFAIGDVPGTLRAHHGGVHAAVAYAIQAGATRVNPASGPDGVGVQLEHAYTIEARPEVQAVAVALRGREGGATAELGGSVGGTLRAGGGGGDKSHVLAASAVRRLTPRECERLQGAPDDWTLVPNTQGKPMADGPRYRMLGNSFAVPVIRWIGTRIDAASQAALEKAA
jgi:DNA (cytosine-5)-methyltransferase 1